MADVMPALPAADPTQGSKPAAAPAGPWTEKTASAWRRRISAALEHTKSAIDSGKTNIARYRGEYLTSKPTTDTALVPTDFYYIEQKKAQLFYRLPDIFLKPMQPGLDDAAIVFQAAINAKMGPAGVNVLPRIKEVLFDTLCPTGFGAVKVGFQPVIGEPPTVPVKIGEEPDIDALERQILAPVPGQVLGLSGIPPIPMKPIMGEAPNIVATRYFIERIAPGDLIVPADFAGSDFDDAAFLGLRFREDLPDDAEGGTEADADERRLVPLSAAAKTSQRKHRIGYEVFYKASLFDADVKHPDVIRVVTFYEDDKTTVPQPKFSPYQRYDERTPEQVTDPRSIRKVEGMPGFCIKPLTLRYVSDGWMAPSDCTMARNTADELSKGRTQMLTFRDRSMPQFGYDATRLDEGVRAKLERNEVGAGIGFNGPGQDATWAIEKGRFGRENFEFDRIGKDDLNRIWGIPESQQSSVADGGRTATELQMIQASSQDRMGSEREQVLTWHVQKIVPAFASLLQLFADEEEFVELVGSDAQRLKAIPPQIQQQAQQAGQNASVLVPWNKHLIQGKFAFTAKPDSQLRLDVAAHREQLMKAYQFLANEPTLNRQELTREVLKAFNFDFAKFTQPPPPKQPEAASGSVSIKAEDFVGPQALAAQVIGRAIGIDVPDQMLQAMSLFGKLWAEMQAQLQVQSGEGAGPQTEHGGAAAQAEPLSKHAAGQTGAMQGMRAPIGPGGHLQ